MNETTMVGREIVPMWVMWNYLAMNQQSGLEWTSPEKKDQDFAIASRKLLRKVTRKA